MIDAANIFTEDAMSRPLFEPLSAKHERPDEWSGPLGFVVGGMATHVIQADRDGALAEQYFNAASALIDAIIDRRVADYQVANAALFLYRHCFELLLTCIIQPRAPRFEKMRVERYVAVLLLSAGHASASPVVDQRWDLHLFVG